MEAWYVTRGGGLGHAPEVSCFLVAKHYSTAVPSTENHDIADMLHGS